MDITFWSSNHSLSPLWETQPGRNFFYMKRQERANGRFTIFFSIIQVK
jgi:hypothetical protein